MTVLDWQSFCSNSPPLAPSAMTIGVFDGVHRGHQELIRRVVSQNGTLLPVAITFQTNPKHLLRRSSQGGDITSLRQKLRLLEELGIHLVVLIDFSGNFSKLRGIEFVDLLKERGNLRYLAVGSDFRCGYRLDTDVVLLKKMNEASSIVTEVVPPVLMGDLPISSSRIRAAIVSGDLVEASNLLGRNVEIDLVDVPPTPRSDGIIFNVRATARLTPPNGRYPVLLKYGQGSQKKEAFIEIQKGMIRIPYRIDCESIEFIV